MDQEKLSVVVEAPVGEHLFPCCGHMMIDLPDQEDVVVLGCPNGEDFEVLHAVDDAQVVVRTTDGREWYVDWSDWQSAVLSFADRVSEFYAASSPKQPLREECDGIQEVHCGVGATARYGSRSSKRINLTLNGVYSYVTSNHRARSPRAVRSTNPGVRKRLSGKRVNLATYSRG